MKQDQGSFATTFGALAAAIGSAAGLGNIWRFPYKMGAEGGAVFLFAYIAIALLICVPVLVSEFAIGRSKSGGIISSIRQLTPKSSWWMAGLVNISIPIMVLFFYLVVGGWVVYYGFLAIIGGFVVDTNFEALFVDFSTSPVLPVVWTFIFCAINTYIVVQGVQKGIERSSAILMPLLGVTLFVLMIYSFTLPHTQESMRFLFVPDWSEFSPNTLLSVLSQAIFSLSLGAGVMVLFGSYMLDTDHLIKNAINITVFSAILYGLISSILVFNVVFAYGFEVNAGPQLIFVVLPAIFSQMPGGAVFGSAFFFLVFIAALTSAMSLLEVIVSSISEKSAISRKVSTLVIMGILFLISTLVSLSFGGYIPVYEINMISWLVFLIIALPITYFFGYRFMYNSFIFDNQWSEPKAKYRAFFTSIACFLGCIGLFYLYEGLILFAIFDVTTDKLLLPIGVLLVSLIAGWKMDRKIFAKQLELSVEHFIVKYFIFTTRYVIPVCIFIILLYSFLF